MNENALKDRVKKISEEKGIITNECWTKLYLERFLARLSRSPLADKFIFKGGFLLSYIVEIGRETSDLDFLLTKLNVEEKEITGAISQIMREPLSDGFSFSLFKVESLDQPHMNYPGFRVTLEVRFGKIKGNIKIDVGVGDIVESLDRDLELFEYQGNPLFEKEISLLVYPVETIFSEKLETIISKGITNSRMKDYHDLIVLIRNESLIDQEKFDLATFFCRLRTHTACLFQFLSYSSGERYPKKECALCLL